MSLQALIVCHLAYKDIKVYLLNIVRYLYALALLVIKGIIPISFWLLVRLIKARS